MIFMLCKQYATGVRLRNHPTCNLGYRQKPCFPRMFVYLLRGYDGLPELKHVVF